MDLVAIGIISLQGLIVVLGCVLLYLDVKRIKLWKKNWFVQSVKKFMMLQKSHQTILFVSGVTQVRKEK